MGCRKNQANLTDAEKTAFVNAVLQLKNTVPSKLHPGDPIRHRYDDYVEVHMNAMMLSDGSMRMPGWAHRGPAFFPWHRELLLQFEKDLQAIDPTVTLPYWDWTVNNSANDVPGSPWADNFMGKMDTSTDKVTTGPFRAGNWTKVILEDGDSDADLSRGLGRTDKGALVSDLPTAAQVNDPVTGALAVIPYDKSPWDDSASTQPSFRNRLEGWYGSGSIHNRVHLWVGGSMLPSTSPNDPIFFLHHCNVDRLWAVWQQQHPSEGYHPTGISGDATTDPGHNLNDIMIFNDVGQPSPWTGSSTPASVLNHHALGYWYDSDPPEITLTTPSISFIDIPEGIGGTGVTTYRAILFEILACADIHLEITAISPGFGTPLGLTTTVPPSHQPPPAIGRQWISYTSTTAGSSLTGSVTVRAIETGQTWIVNISANTVSRPKSAVVLVLDHSGSMSEDAGSGEQKVSMLRRAVLNFVNVMLPGDGLGIVRFDDSVQRLMDVIDVGPVSPIIPGSGRDLAYGIVTSNQLDPAGATSIGGGVVEGKLTLDTAPTTVPPYSVRAMLVLTDGMENTPPMIADVRGSITSSTFAVGFGSPANISISALNALTQDHNGYLVVTGTITADQSFRLTKYFLQILAGINNANVVLDPQGDLVYGATHRIPFSITESDMGIDVILLSPAPYLVDFLLETPDGRIINPTLSGVEPAIQFVTRGEISYYRVSLPAIAASPSGSHAGRWYALLTLGHASKDIDASFIAQINRRVLPYSLLVHSYSNLLFKAALQQKSFDPGAEVLVLASLKEYDVPVEGRARVWAEITYPNGFVSITSLQEVENGEFRTNLTMTSSGLYIIRVRAEGTTFTGRPFQREQSLTAAAYKGGDHDLGNKRDPSLVDWLKERDSRLCKLLLCLLRGSIMGSEFGKQLAAKGIDLDELRKCLETFCKEERVRPMEGSTKEAIAERQVLNITQLLKNADVQRAILASTSAAGGTHRFEELKEGESLVRQAIERKPHLEHKKGPSVMFDLSPEDKAALKSDHASGATGKQERNSRRINKPRSKKSHR